MGDKNIEKRLKELKEKERLVLENIRAEMENKTFQNSLFEAIQKEKEEAETERLLCRAEETQGWRANEVKQEESLARELDESKRQHIAELKRRQQLRETPELRLFQQQLLNAYANKELMMQIAQNKLRDKSEKVLDKRTIEKECEEHEMLEKLERERMIKQIMKKKEYRDILQDQMITKYKAKQEEYKQFLEEKALIDEAVRATLEEEKREEEEQWRRRERTKEEERLFWKAREYWIQKEKETQEAEDRRIQEYLTQKFEKEKLLQERNREKEEIRVRRREMVSKKLSDILVEQSEKEALSNFLIEAEMYRKLKEEEKHRMETKQKGNKELQQIFRNQIEDQLARIEEERNKDIEYSKHLMDLMAEDIRKEKASKEMQKQKLIQYGKELKEDIDRKHRQRIQDMQEEFQFYECQEQAKLERKKLIEEERMKMLQEHAEQLAGFFPKGVLKESDFTHLSPQIKAFYQSKNARPE